MAGDHIREIHVVCNTHWDREFRDSFEKTRAKLVECLDTVLDLLRDDPAYASFTLDGQAIVAEDYLEMRPERRAEFSERLRTRRLFLGPWYTLPDAMNVGAEALVRNLQRGRRVARSLGGEPMKAGYIPANWGQPGQIPQILRGFGIDSALIYRGISPHECPSEWIWRAPNGDEVVAHRFARLARYNWYYAVHRPATRGKDWLDKDYRLEESTELPVRVADGQARGASNFTLRCPAKELHAGRVAAAVQHLLDLEAADSSTGLFLAMHGHDISVPHPLDPKVVRLAREALAGKRIVISNLEDFMARVSDALDRSTAIVLTGERRTNLKEGYWTYLLPGTISIRTPLKVMNFEAETALTLVAEPLAALAAVHGAAWPERELDRAWGFLLGNHTHDAIAGCAPDAVSADVQFRARQAMDLADTVAERAMAFVAGRTAGSPLTAGTARLIAFNTLPFDRREVLDVEVALPPGVEAEALCVTGEEERSLACEEISFQDDSLFVDSPWDVPAIAQVKMAMLRIDATLRACGPTTLHIGPGEPPLDLDDAVAADGRVIDNGLLSIEAQRDGTVTLLHRASGRRFNGLGRFLDEGAAGTFWWPKPLPHDQPILSGGEARVEITDQGALSATLSTQVTMNLPVQAVNGERRSPQAVPVRLETHWTLRRGDPLVHVEVLFTNPCRDHRLRVLFPTGVRTGHVAVGAHFDVVRRPIAHPDCTGWVEPHQPTAPMQGFVDLSDAGGGLALIPHGLLEYEVFDDADRTLALTLIRAIPIRLAVSEEKQEVLPDTGPLCLGPLGFRFALFPHEGDPLAAACWQQAQRFNTPVRVLQAGAGPGKPSPLASLIRVDNPRVTMTALTRSEDSRHLAVRLFNPGDSDQPVTLAIDAAITAAWRARLDETPGEAIRRTGEGFGLTLSPHEIATVLLALPDGGRPSLRT